MVSLKGVTGIKSTHIRISFCMLTNVTQGFKLQRPDFKTVVELELCSDCLSLSIVLLYKNMQPREKEIAINCVSHKKNEVNCIYVAQKLTERKFLAEKCVGYDRYFQPMLIESVCKTKN